MESYLAFLKAGGSAEPAELLKIAGVDPYDDATYDQALEFFAGLVDEYESLVSGRVQKARHKIESCTKRKPLAAFFFAIRHERRNQRPEAVANRLLLFREFFTVRLAAPALHKPSGELAGAPGRSGAAGKSGDFKKHRLSVRRAVPFRLPQFGWQRVGIDRPLLLQRSFFP